MTVRRRPRLLLALLATTALLGPGLGTGLVPAAAAATPVVTGVAAGSGSTAGGTYATVRGTGFTGVTRVAFGGATTTSLHVWSSTELTVRVPAHGAGRVSVRVARPGAASAATAAATYTYAPTPRPLVLTGPSQTAPAVDAFPSQPDAVEMSCASSTLCAAVGPRGLATYDGAGWSALTATPTPTQGHATNPHVSCAGTLCLAISYDTHVWRWNGSWTDLGEKPGITSVSCGGPTLCAARVDDQAVVYDGSSWGPAATLFDGGVAAVACGSATSCVADSSSGYYRTWSAGWSASKAMWTTAALRENALTETVFGHLTCASATSCESYTSRARNGELTAYASWTGGAWSVRQVVPLPAGKAGDHPTSECVTSSFCVTTGTVFGAGDNAFPWVVSNGTAASTPSTFGLAALGCWAPYSCLALLRDGTSRKVVAG